MTSSSLELVSRRNEKKSKSKQVNLAISWERDREGGVCSPSKLPLQVSHVLLTLSVVRHLGLDEVIQAAQVVSLVGQRVNDPQLDSTDYVILF